MSVAGESVSVCVCALAFVRKSGDECKTEPHTPFPLLHYKGHCWAPHPRVSHCTMTRCFSLLTRYFPSFLPSFSSFYCHMQY